MKRIGFIAVAFILLGLASCNNENKTYTKRSIGSTSEILVVTQTQEQWDGPIGDSIRAFFGQYQYGLPQAEPIFKIININVAKFDDLFETYRSILAVEIDPAKDRIIIERGDDHWAKPQRSFKLIAPDTESWLTAFAQKRDDFRAEFEQMERERLMEIFRPSTDKKIVEKLREKFGIEMNIPEGYYIAKSEDGFMWIRKPLERQETGFFIYEQPYTSETDFDPRRIIQLRDIALYQNVPGPLEGSYMSTDKEMIIPRAQEIGSFAGADYAVEIRGLWEVEGDWMAGPFLSYTVATPEADRLITVEGYVYQPNKDKRDLLRQAEAILYSTKFYRETQNGVEN